MPEHGVAIGPLALRVVGIFVTDPEDEVEIPIVRMDVGMLRNQEQHLGFRHVYQS